MDIDKPTRYLAGIWQHELPNALMWHVYGEKKGLRASSYRAPSWSWASVDGEINSDFFGWETSYTNLLTISECMISPVSPLVPYGAVCSGYLTVSGRLSKMHLHVDTYALAFSKIKNEGELLLQGLSDTSNENIPGGPIGKWLHVFCLEVGYHPPEGVKSEDPGSRCPFGLILTPAVGCHHGSRGYLDEEAVTKFSPETVFRRVGIFDSKDLETSKIMSFEDCPNKEITIV
jgi:hypothetical protein